VVPVERGGATGPEGRVAGARHRGTPAREAAEQPSTEQRSKEAGGQGGREVPPRRAGREGGRRHHRAKPSREAGPSEGPKGRVGWWSRPAARHHGTAGGSRSREGAEAAEWRTPVADRHQTGGDRARAGHRAARCLAAPVGAGVRRWAEKITLNIFSANLRVGHGPPDPPCRSAPAQGTQFLLAYNYDIVFFLNLFYVYPIFMGTYFFIYVCIYIVLLAVNIELYIFKRKRKGASLSGSSVICVPIFLAIKILMRSSYHMIS
jgi:hypothetical protein